MKHIKKALSFVIVFALIIGMIPLSAITAFASQNTNGINYDNIPHGNTHLVFSDSFLNNTKDIYSYKIIFDDYYNTEGKEIKENVISMYGNVLYAYCYFMNDSATKLYFYLKDITTGEILYVSTSEIKITEICIYDIIDDEKIEQLSGLISVCDENGNYDIINVYTATYFDYNLVNNLEEIIGDYAVISAGSNNVGLMNRSGTLEYPLEFVSIKQNVFSDWLLIKTATDTQAVNMKTKEIKIFNEYENFYFTDNGFVRATLLAPNDSKYPNVIFDKNFNLLSNESYSSIYIVGNSLLCCKPGEVKNTTGKIDSDNYDLITKEGKIIDLAKKFNSQAVSCRPQYDIIDNNKIEILVYSAKYTLEVFGYKPAQNVTSFEWTYGWADPELGFWGCINENGEVVIDLSEKINIVPSRPEAWQNGEMGPLTVSVDGVKYVLEGFSSDGISVDYCNGAYALVKESHSTNPETGLVDYTYEAEYYSPNGKKYNNVTGNSRMGIGYFNGRYIYTSDGLHDLHSGEVITFDGASLVESGNDYLFFYFKEDENYQIYFLKEKTLSPKFKSYDYYYEYKGKQANIVQVSNDDGSYIYHKTGSLIKKASQNDYCFELENGKVVITNASEYYYCIYSGEDGSLISQNENQYIYSSRPDSSGNYSIRTSDGKYGLLDGEGNVGILPEDTSQIYHLNFGMYSAWYTLYDAYGNVVLLGEDDYNPAYFGNDHIRNYYQIAKCGSLLTRSSMNNDYYIFWLDEKINSQITKKISNGSSLSFEKKIISIDEETIVYVKDKDGKNLEYDGKYSVKSSDEIIAEVETQGTGLVVAKVKGKSVGNVEVVITLDNGTVFKGNITVSLSNKNLLEMFPNIVFDNKYTTIFKEALDCCVQINNSYSNWNDVVVSYFSALSSGGQTYISKHLLDKIGLIPEQQHEYEDAAVLALMKEISKIDSITEDIVANNISKWSNAKKCYNITNESLKEFSKYAANISNFSESDIFVCASEILNAYGKTISEVGNGVDIYEILMVILCTESINIDVVNKLLDSIDADTALYDGLERLKISLQSGLTERIINRYIKEKLIEKVAEKITKNKIVGFGSVSPITMALSNICIELIVDYYEEMGGVMASELAMAQYTTSFVMQLDSALLREQKLYEDGKVVDSDRYEFLYNAYISSMCLALESCSKICKPEYAYLSERAQQLQNLIAHRCTFDMFMEACRQKATNEYPKDYSVSLNDSGQIVVTAKNISTFRLLKADNPSETQEKIIYIPAVIDETPVFSIDCYAFYGDNSIKGVIIEEGVQCIGEGAFENCENLEFVVLGNVTEVSERAFANCTSLSNIVFSNNMANIKPHTFEGCSNLSLIDIPKNIINIEENAFLDSVVTSLIINGSQTTVSKESGLNPSQILSVPNESVDILAESLGIKVSKEQMGLDSISIHNLPTKTEFTYGEEINTEGLVLEIINGESIEFIDSGFIIAHEGKIGKQNVTVYYQNACTTYEINVLPLELNDFTISCEKTNMQIGECQSIQVTTVPLCSTSHLELSFNSNNKRVAKIDNGIVFAVGEGEATITIRDEKTGIEKKIDIQVSSQEEFVLDENQKTKIIYKHILNEGMYRFSCSCAFSISIYDAATMQLLNRGFDLVEAYLTKDVVVVLNKNDLISQQSGWLYIDSTLATLEYVDILENQEYILTSDIDSGIGLFSFVPEVDGMYVFYSYDNDFDTYGYILDENMNTLDSDDDNGEGNNFKVVYSLVAGTQYYLKAEPLSSGSIGEYRVKVVKLVPATSVNIIPDGDINFFEGYEYRVDAELDPENSIDEALTWTSSNTSVATIDNDGNITALAAGTSTITVTTENGLTDSITVTVHTPEEIELNETKDTTITSEMDRNVFSFTPSEDGQYIIKISGDYYTQTSVQDSEMNWINSNSGYYYSFKVTLSADENYSIATRLWEEALNGDYTITIEKLVPATSLEITQEGTDGGYVGDYGYLYTNFGPENAIDEEITWVSSNPEVAAIVPMYNGGVPDSSYVRINFVSAGTTTITATSENGLTDTIVITVIERPSLTSIQIGNGDNLTGYVGVPKYLWVNLYPDGAAHEQLTWSSDNESVATVNEEGKVEFLSTGTVTITVETESGLSDTCTINVGQIATLTIGQPVNLTIVDNEEQYVKFIPTESGLFRIYVSDFSNDNEARITILDENMNWLDSTDHSSFINYEFEAGETYYIETNYCSYSGSGNGTYNLNAIKPGPATAISFDIGSEYSGYVGTSRYVNVIYSPEHAMTESITWSSSDSSIVSVSRYGQITLNATGSATITATTENGLVFSCVVTVEDFETIEAGQEKDVVLDGDEAYYYFTPNEDGYYSFYSYDNDHDTYGYILNSDMEEITSDDDGGDGNNFKVRYQLEAGVTYVLKARFYNTENSGSFKVCVEQIKYVTALEIISMPEKTEYVEGYVNQDNINYYGLKLKVTWSDGSTTDWKYNYDWSVEGEYIYRDASDVGETGNVELTCGDASVTLALTIIENPVDHIEIVSGTEFSYVENYNGYIDENEDGEFFYYHTNYPSDVVIKIVYKNGSSETARVGDSVNDYSISWDHNQYNEAWVVGTNNKSIVTYLGHSVVLPITVKENKVTSIEVVSGKVTCIENAYGYETEDGYYYYYDMPDDVTLKINYSDETFKIVNIGDKVDGYWFGWDDDQEETPWVLGDNNYLTVTYLGQETQLPVSVIVSPVERIVINSAPSRQYIYGDREYGYLYSDSEYEFYPTDLTGLSFTVYYVDGTNKTFTADDIDEYGDINGYGYELYYDEYNAQIGDFPVQFMYMGKTADYVVKLKESTVSSIAVTKQPNKTEFGNYYSPDFIGMELTITYTDESTKVVTLTEDNLVYEYNPWWGELTYTVDVNGYNLTIEPYYGENTYYVAYYLGAQCDITNMTFTNGKEIKSIDLGNVSSHGDGMNIKITYADETTETLTLDIATFYDFEDSSVAGFGKTENGLLYYYIETYTDDNGKPEKYRVYIFNEEITVEADAVVIGDVNGDGDVNNKDVTMLRRYLVGGWNVSIDELAADINGDGDVNNKDVTMLRRYLVGGWNVALG